ncbi:MAG: hypothetical protein RSB77_03200 [Bacilli bacterium]
MKIAKDIMFLGLGAASVFAYQKYGDKVVASVEEMMDKKLRIAKKIDDELEDMM